MIEKIVQYQSLGLSPAQNSETIKYNDIEIKMRKPSSSDKLDLIEATLQKSLENGIYNTFKLEVYFNLNLIYIYTNIMFTNEDRIDELELYDNLESNGIIQKVIDKIPHDEYGQLLGAIETISEKREKYNSTVAAVLAKVIDDLPKNAEAAMEIVNNFDPDKFEAVKAFAEAANGGRPIPTANILNPVQ